MVTPRKRSGSSSSPKGQIISKEKKISVSAVTEDGVGAIATVPVCGDQGGSGRAAHVPFAPAAASAAAAAAAPFAPPPHHQYQQHPTLQPLQQQLPLLDQVAATSYINAVQQQQLLLSQQHSPQHLQPQHSQAVSLGLHNLMLYDQYLNYASKFV